MREYLIEEKEFSYVKKGEGEPMVLLHGLFGTLSNWTHVVEHFSKKGYCVYIPLLPIYEGKTLDKVHTSVEGLTDFVTHFLEAKQLKKVHMVGNSLGGHIALVYALKHGDNLKSMCLTGSSGLFEAGLGSTFPRRQDRKYVKERVEYTFYDPRTATKALVDEVFAIINNRLKALRIIHIARNAQRTNLRDQLPNISTPTCLIWGLNDNITPPYVAHEFHKLLPNAKLYFIDECGHAPMMEQPQRFNEVLENFLKQL